MLFCESLKSTCTAKDIYKVVTEYLLKHDIPISNIISTTFDGAPAMMGSRYGVLKLLKDENRRTEKLLNIYVYDSTRKNLYESFQTKKIFHTFSWRQAQWALKEHGSETFVVLSFLYINSIFVNQCLSTISQYSVSLINYF